MLYFQLPLNFAYMNSRKNAGGSDVFSVNQMENKKIMIHQGFRKKLCTVNYNFSWYLSHHGRSTKLNCLVNKVFAKKTFY